MGDDIITQLQEASTDEQKTWIITHLTLKCLPIRLAKAVMVAAVPHWFDAPLLTALLSVDMSEAEERYNEIKMLSFSEPFGELGYSLHDLTRAGIVSHLVSAQPEDFQKWSQGAYDYFRRFDDAQNIVEAVYHLLTVDKEQGWEKFKKLWQRYIQYGNFSAANNLLRNVHELVKVGLLDGAEHGEMDWNDYLLAKELISRGKAEEGSEKKRQYAKWAVEALGREEESFEYETLDLSMVFERLNTILRDFLPQRLKEAERAGDIGRQDFLAQKINEGTKRRFDDVWQELERLGWLHQYWLPRYSFILYTEALINDGEAHLRNGEYSAALADFTRALEIDKDNVRALSSRGITYFLRGNYPAALADFTQLWFKIFLKTWDEAGAEARKSLRRYLTTAEARPHPPTYPMRDRSGIGGSQL